MRRNEEFQRGKEVHSNYMVSKGRRRGKSILIGILILSVITLAGFLLKDRLFADEKISGEVEAGLTDTGGIETPDPDQIAHEFQSGSMEES